MLEATGGRYPLEGGRQSELEACDAISYHNSYGDVQDCAVLECSYALLFAWISLA